MRESMYSAMFGALSNEHRMDLVANNLANVNTTGYKKDETAFHDTFQRFAHDYLVDGKPYLRDKDLFPRPTIMSKPRLSDQLTNFEQGSMSPTENPLDFAITGEGFFKVRTPDGDFLTRSGSFQLSPDGTIVTEQGFQVLGGGGPIVIPPGSGRPEVDGNGQISVDGQVVGNFDVVTVSDLSALEKYGRNLYQIGTAVNAQEVPATEAQVNQGYIEKSNVEVVSEMVNMIETQRAFEAYTKIMKSTDELESQLQNKVATAAK